MGVEHGNQEEKPTPEANRYESEGKVCFLEKKQAEKHMACVFREESKQENTNRKFQVNFRVDFCISTQIYIYKDKKRTRHENKECYI